VSMCWAKTVFNIPGAKNLNAPQLPKGPTANNLSIDSVID
jgi:hypothetical protein